MLHKSISEEHRFAIWSSCLAIAFLILPGCLLWNRLPAEMAVHFTFENQPDSLMPKAFVVLGMPCLLLGLQLVCVFGALHQPSASAIWTTAHVAPHSQTLLDIVLWIVPGIGLLVLCLIYAYALGAQPNIGLWVQLGIGVILIVLGNAMPKGAASLRLSRNQNLPADIRQRISRFWGYSLVLGGVAICLCAVADNLALFFAIILIITVIPFLFTISMSRNPSR